MELENVSVEIRPRNPWEAMDLGFSMVQRWWRPIYRAWFAVLLPLTLVLHLIFFDNPLLAALALWWLKPFLDRVLLHMFSHTVFGETPSVRDTLKALPGLLRTGLVWHLTFLRLDPSRSFRLPVMQLEGLSGKERRARYRVLARRGGSYAQGLTLICLHLESFITLGLLGLLYMLVPTGSDLNPFALLTESSAWAQVASNMLYLVPLTLIEPGYVAAGFALYLNRRTELEGWDIELKFRRMAGRLEGLGRRMASAAAVVVLAVMLGHPGMPARAAIEDEPLAPTALPADSVAKTIEDVLAHEDFIREKTYTLWVPKEKDTDETVEMPSWQLELSSSLAEVAKIVLWGLVAVAIVLFIVYHDRWLPSLTGGNRPETRAPPRSVSGFDLRPESLPEDIPGTALSLWRARRAREALSLLYRGCLSTLVNQHRLELPESATEGDVLRLAQGQVPAHTGAFLDRTTRLWQTLAYAHMLPADPEVTAVCQDWHQSLEAAP